MSNFLKFYLGYVVTRDNANSAIGRGPLAYYAELFFHIVTGVLVFSLTQETGKWVLIGWATLLYSVIQAYAWLWWYPRQEYLRPVHALNARALLNQYGLIQSAASRFCEEIAAGGGKPVRAAGTLVDAIIGYYALQCSIKGPSVIVAVCKEIQLWLKEAAETAGTAPLIFTFKVMEGSDIPRLFSIYTHLKSGESFTFKRPL